MIRLYLKAYKPDELCQLYNALHVARSTIPDDGKSYPISDLDEALSYLSGYLDAKGDSGK